MKQLVLFGAKEPLACEFSAAIQIQPKYVYEYEKDSDGKRIVIKDKKGNPVLAKGADGGPIVGSEIIKLLPMKSKDGPDLESVTGKSGAGLKQWVRETSDLLADASLAELNRLRATNQYTFARQTRNRKTGAITTTFKPVFGGKSIAVAKDDELADEMRRRGFIVERNPATDNGDQAELPGTEEKAPEAPKAPPAARIVKKK